MPITVKHGFTGFSMPNVDPQKYNTGMGMAQQERKYAMDTEMLNQRQDYAMDAMQMRNAQDNPSIGDDDAMVEQEIRSGRYDPDTVRSLRDDQRAARLILRDRNLNATQQAEALANLRSRMRMTRSTGKVQPMMQQMPPAALQTKPPMTEAEYFSDEKNYANGYAAAQARLEAAGSNTPATPENIQAQMHNDYLARQKFLEGLRQPQGQPPAMGAQPLPAQPGQVSSRPTPLINEAARNLPSQAYTPSGTPLTQPGQPQASFTGGNPVFGSSPVLAQGGFQQGGSAYSPSIALAPGHPNYKPLPTPTDRRDERGYVIMSDGSKVDPRDSFAMSTGGRGQQAVMRLTHPDGSQKERRTDNIREYYDSNAPVGQPLTQGSFTGGDPVFGSPPVLAMPASQSMPGVATGATLPATPMSQQPAQQQPMYPTEAIASSRVDPGYMAPQDSGFASARTFTSADGRSMVGSILGINPPSSNGGFSTVQIRRESDGKVFDVPLNNLSQQDQQYALSGGNRDTMYDLQNPNRSSGTDFMDPNNPVRQEMSAADQSIVNPQKRTLGSEYKGRYGLGGADYGINPATGNRVTASVRPGGTMLEYDPPGPTKEQVAKDNAAKQKQRDFNERVRKSQGRGTNNQTLVAGDAAPQGGQMQPSAPQDTPALTQLLATMTPSQRRDYSKWLMEEPDRYAMRNQIAQQQLNQTAAAARGNGQLPKYPGLQQRIQERNQQQGRVPMQGNAGQQSPPVEMGIDQAIAIARNPNASEEDQKKAVDVMKKNGITTVDQAKEAVGRVASPPVTDQGVVPSPNDPRYQDRRGGASPYPYSETYKGGAVSPQRPAETDVLDAYELLRNNPTSNRAITPEMESAMATLRAYGLQDEDISNLKMGYSVQGNAGDYAVVKAYETVRNSTESTRRLSPETSAAMEVLKKNGYSDKEIASIKAGGSAKKPPAVKKPATGKDPSKAESTVQQDAASKPNEVNVRKWTSADGKKTFDGSLVGLSYDDVNGRRVAVFNSTDGRVFKIPIENLSEDDQSRLLAASAIEKATDRQSSDFSKYGVKIGIGEKYSAPKTSGKTRPSKGKGRGTSTDPSSKWPDEVIRSIPARTARDSKRTS